MLELLLVVMIEARDASHISDDRSSPSIPSRFVPRFVLIGLTPHALAALTTLRTLSRRDFLCINTWKRPKSESFRRFSAAARFFAHAVDSHLATMPASSTYFLTVPEPALRGSLGTVRGVRVRWR